MEGGNLLNAVYSSVTTAGYNSSSIGAATARYEDRYNATESKPTAALFIVVFRSQFEKRKSLSLSTRRFALHYFTCTLNDEFCCAVINCFLSVSKFRIIEKCNIMTF